MREDDNILAIIFICALILGLMIGTALGIKLTRSDIYSRCADQNKTMVYEEVHKLCTERSK